MSMPLLGLNFLVSALTIVSNDKVRGRNKAHRWLRSVCARFFITNITQPDTISQDTIIMSYTYTPEERIPPPRCFVQWIYCCSIFSFLFSILSTIVCLFFLPFFGHCIFSPSSNYGFWLPLWYFQTFLVVQCVFSWWMTYTLSVYSWPTIEKENDV